MSKLKTLRVKKAEPKGKAVGSPQLIAAQIMSDPNLMEVEIKYNNIGGTQIKAMLDTSEGSKLILKVFEDNLLVHEVEKVIPRDPNLGEGPASDEFQEIKLGSVWL